MTTAIPADIPAPSGQAADARGTVAADGPRAVVLLCAGRGTRMHPLTLDAPKCMLEVGDRKVIDHLLDAILARSDGEIVAVTGFGADAVRDHLASRYGDRVGTAHNPRYEEDVNILSVETGVAALRHPERGYIVVETDLLLDASAWDRVFAQAAGPDAFWLCRGRYAENLTGGIVHAGTDGWIDAVEYRPAYDAAYAGWPKMVGILGVGPGQVAADRETRRQAMAVSIAQYYLVPWRDHLPQLPCRVLQIDDCFAHSFNTVADYERIARQYTALAGHRPSSVHA